MPWSAARIQRKVPGEEDWRLWDFERHGNYITRWWFQIFFYVHPYLGKWSNLTNIFQVGWNRQLDKHFTKTMRLYYVIYCGDMTFQNGCCWLEAMFFLVFFPLIQSETKYYDYVEFGSVPNAMCTRMLFSKPHRVRDFDSNDILMEECLFRIENHLLCRDLNSEWIFHWIYCPQLGKFGDVWRATY